MRFSYVKPLPVGKAFDGLLVGVEVVEDDAGQFGDQTGLGAQPGLATAVG